MRPLLTAPGRIRRSWLAPAGPYGIVRQLMAAVPPGSYLAVSHGASDVDPGVAEGARQFNERAATPMTLRAKAECARFFDGLELQGPGVVTLDAWHLGGGQPRRHPPRLLRSRLQELTARVGFAGVSGRSGS
jgi:hypothetical protein